MLNVRPSVGLSVYVVFQAPPQVTIDAGAPGEKLHAPGCKLHQRLRFKLQVSRSCDRSRSRQEK